MAIHNLPILYKRKLWRAMIDYVSIFNIFRPLLKRKIRGNSPEKIICVDSTEAEMFVKSDSVKSCLPANIKNPNNLH